MTEESPTEWEHLGQLMRARRVELGGVNRTRFLEDRGLGESQYRLIMDMENGKRGNFEQSTIDLVEYVYEWEPGSVAAVRAGGRPTARIVEAFHAEEVTAAAPVIRLEEAIGLDDDDARAFADLIVADRHLVDDARAHLLHQYGLLRRIPPESSEHVDSDRPPLRAVAEHGNPAHRGELRRLAREAREGYEAHRKGSGDLGDDHE